MPSVFAFNLQFFFICLPLISFLQPFEKLAKNDGHQWRIQTGSRGSLEPPFKTKLFQFHGDFHEDLGKTSKTNPPFAI